MPENSPDNHNIIRKRSPALFGLFVLALFQLSFAGHQLQHPADHGISVCELCTAYNELDEVPLAAAPAVDLATQPSVLISAPAPSVAPTQFDAGYQSRAPPLS